MKLILRNIMYILGAFFVVLVLAYASLYFYKEKRNLLAEEMIKMQIERLNDFKSTHGRYPDKLADLPGFNDIKQKVLWVFPASEIYYRSDHNTYRICYHIFPFGPFRGYDEKAKEWYYEE